MGEIGDRKAVPALVEALKVRTEGDWLEGTAGVAESSAASLTRLRDSSCLRAVAAQLVSKDPCPLHPGEVGGPKPLGDLVALHLADFGKEAADCVAPYLESANGEVRLRAAVALGLVGDSRGEPVLVEWLGDKGRSGFRRLLRGPPEALAKLADPALLPRLRAMLSDQEDHWLADRILQAYPSQLRNGK